MSRPVFGARPSPPTFASYRFLWPLALTVSRKRRTAMLLPARPPPLHAQAHDALEQWPVLDADVRSRGGEILAVGDLRVGIGLDHVHLAVDAHPEVDARVAGQLERAVGAPRDALHQLHGRFRQRRRTGVDAVPLLVLGVPLHA